MPRYDLAVLDPNPPRADREDVIHSSVFDVKSARQAAIREESDHFADYFDRYEAREVRSLMQGNRADFLR